VLSRNGSVRRPASSAVEVATAAPGQAATSPASRLAVRRDLREMLRRPVGLVVRRRESFPRSEYWVSFVVCN
jgi:hypothetical protein